MNVAVVFAGGVGSRMGSAVPKQFLELNGRPVLAHALGIFQSHPRVDRIILVAAPERFDDCLALAARYGITKLERLAACGDSAQASIYNGLRSAAELFPPETTVLLHDGVRPYLEPWVVDANLDAVERFGSAVTYTPCYETIVVSKDGETISAMPYRRESYTVQAPQSFRLGDILAAHERIRARPEGYADMVDQATICWTLGLPIHLVRGNRGNVKITTPEDIVMLEALLRRQAAGGSTLTGKAKKE